MSATYTLKTSTGRKLPETGPRYLLRDDKPDASEWGDALRPLLLCVYGILEWQVRETGGARETMAMQAG